MMIAATGFWAYIYFCQYLLIWYANVPEETLYFIARQEQGWAVYLAALPALKFVVPFVVLAPREAKRRPGRVIPVAVLLLVAQVWELFVMVAPAAGPAHLPLVEFASAAGFLGLFYLVFERSLASHNAVPLKDPGIRECLEFHQ